MTTFLFLLLLGAEPAPPSASLLTEKMRLDIALAQRNYVVIKQQEDQSVAELRARLDLAEKACGAERKTFDPQTITCVAPAVHEEPKPPK